MSKRSAPPSAASTATAPPSAPSTALPPPPPFPSCGYYSEMGYPKLPSRRFKAHELTLQAVTERWVPNTAAVDVPYTQLVVKGM